MFVLMIMMMSLFCVRYNVSVLCFYMMLCPVWLQDNVMLICIIFILWGSSLSMGHSTYMYTGPYSALTSCGCHSRIQLGVVIGG